MSYGAHVQGEVHSIDDDKATVIASPGAGHKLHITRGVISIITVDKISPGYLYLCDEATPPTIYWSVSAGALSQAISHLFDFGDEGLQLDDDNALMLGATGSPYAYAAFVGYTR